MIEIQPLEVLPVLIYLLMLLYLGFRERGKNPDEEDFILGGRQLTLPAFVATLVTTWYGGILGVGEFTFRFGLSNWVVFGLPYYIFAIIFALCFASRVRKSALLSIPDQIYENYGKSNGVIGTIYTFFMTLPAPYVLMVGFMIRLITGWELWICVLIGVIFSMIYVVNGGFRSVVRTDILQFILMFAGFGFVFTILIKESGGLSFLKDNLPAMHLTIHGGNSVQYILVWYLIAIWTLVDPGFHQRCYAAKSHRIARRGILFSVLFWMIFDFLTTATGLYARALLPNIDPVLGYPILSHQILPPLLSGLFLTGLLATIMSTLDSQFLLSAVTLGHDLFGKLFSKTKIQKVKFTQSGLVLSAVISISLALAFPSVIQLWYVIGTLFIPPMLIPVIGSYYRYFNLSKFYARLNLILPFLISLIFLILSFKMSESLSEFQYWLGIQPMYTGLLMSIIIFGFSKLKKVN